MNYAMNIELDKLSLDELKQLKSQIDIEIKNRSTHKFQTGDKVVCIENNIARIMTVRYYLGDGIFNCIDSDNDVCNYAESILTKLEN